MPPLAFSFDSAGRLASLSCFGLERAAPAPCPLFLAQMRDDIGNPVNVSGADFDRVETEPLADGLRLRFRACRKVRGVEATVEVRRADAREIRWRARVDPGTPRARTEWIDFPRVRLRHEPGGRLLLPVSEGTLLDDPAVRGKPGVVRPCYAEYPLGGMSGFYPGPAPAPVEAYWRDGRGVCVFCADPANGPKTVDAWSDGDDAFRTLLQQFTGGRPEAPGEVRFVAFEGDWQDAAALYRDWMEANDPTLPRRLSEGRLPPWMARAPVVVAYPVKGRGLDLGALEPNEYFPYENALPALDRLRAEWGAPLLALLMHWEGTAPWAPPYLWPPFGGEAALRAFAEALHRRGDALGLYGSGIGWTQRSLVDPSYDRRERFEREGVGREICIGPRGERWARVCNGLEWGQRLGYELCAARGFTRRTVEAEVGAAAAAGVDYLQYFDQNQGGSAPLCFSRGHGHPDLPGAWHTEAMRGLLGAAAEAAGSTVLGCENAVAEPYLEVCRLNDSRSHLAWACGGVPVPLHSFLFHEYASGFSGNAVGLFRSIDFDRSPGFVRWHLAWHFVAGNLPTVVLKDGGAIHWCWTQDWAVPPPAQAPLLRFVGALARLRRGAAAPFLVAGRMERAPRVECEETAVHRVGLPDVSVPAVPAAAWRSADGARRALVLANPDETPHVCTVEEEGAAPAPAAVSRGRPGRADRISGFCSRRGAP